ncbi:MAG: cell envelope integrity protein CreD [Pseudomonadota bacterium]
MSVNPLLAKGFVTFLVVGILLIPLSMISSVIEERSHYRLVAAQSIAERWTGSQTLIGPVLALRYRVQVDHEVYDKRLRRDVTETRSEFRHTFIAPTTLDLSANVATEERAYGIHAVPVYSADIAISGELPAVSLEQVAASIDGFERWDRAELILGVADARGFAAVPEVRVGGIGETVAPGSVITADKHAVSVALALDAISAPLPINVSLRLRGSTTLGVVPLAEEGSYTIAADWPHPQFGGRFLPAERNIAAEGFNARWEVTHFASSAAATLVDCGALGCSALVNDVLSTAFVDPIDIYTQAARATKYAMLLILVTFVVFFLLEMLTLRRLHGVNYALVGGSLVVFYLLLLSLAEHIGFAAAYAVAAVACIGLAAYYLMPALGRRLALVYAALQALLSGAVYGILQSEDHALMAGSLLVFTMLAVAMLATRNIDWHRLEMKLPA